MGQAVKHEFLFELAKLMEKHNAKLFVERVWDNDFDSHAELYFMIGGSFFEGFSAESPKEVSHADVFDLYYNTN